MLASLSASQRRRLFLVILAGGLVARLVIVATTIGCNDMEAWTIFSGEIAQRSICSVYLKSGGGPYNHPPLVGWLFSLLFRFTQLIHIPFYLAFKLFPVAADVLVGWLLWRRLHARAGARVAAVTVCAWAWNPHAILLSAFHGNTDSICVALAFASVCLLDEERPLLAGLALGLALDVKLIPLLLLPVLLATLRRWRALGLSALGFVMALLPFVPVALSCPGALYHSVLSYAPHFDNWGIRYVLALNEGNPRWGEAAHGWLESYVASARPFLAGSIILLAILGRLLRRWNRAQLGTLTFALFLLITPGFGIQYTVYVVPFWFACDLSWGVCYALASGLFAGAFYARFLSHELPYLARAWGRFPPPVPYFGLVAWTLLLVWTVKTLVLPQRRSPQSAED